GLAFVGSSAHFDMNLQIVGVTNSPGTPGGASLQLSPQSYVSATTTGGTHTLTVELTSTGFTAPPGSPLSLSSSAGGEVITSGGDTVTATYQGVLDASNT